MWKVIEGHPNYSVSIYGQVKNNKTDYIKNIRVKNGYCFVGLTVSKRVKKWVSLHRLVAIHFIPNPENKEQVNHKDSNPQNNCIDNLEWNTRIENIQHSIKSGFSNPMLKRIRPVYQYSKEGIFIKEHQSGRFAARELNMAETSISKVALGETYRITAGGFRWAFKDRVLPVRIL